VSPVALITGIAGQSGSYLAELLLEKGYIVHGIKRRASSLNTSRIDHLYRDPHQPDARLFLHYGDMTDGAGLTRLLASVRPHEVYHLAGQSHVQVSFELPEYTTDVGALGTIKLLEAIKLAGLTWETRLLHAASSEMFGNCPPPQNEVTPFAPCSSYAVAKLAAYWSVVNARHADHMHASNAIAFNHESPRRGPTFVTRKIARGVAAIASGKQEVLYLGNLESRRDWSHARDIVRGYWLMMQQDRPDDYVLASGESHNVADFLGRAFKHVGIDLGWSYRGIDLKTGAAVVNIDSRYFRPLEVHNLCGDAAKAREVLGWKPTVSFTELVHEMVDAEVQALRAGTEPCST
jgi:GDPmannose 4,6-dehydratase